MSTIVTYADRFFIIRIAKWLIINIYMPCHETADRDLIINSCLSDITSYIENFSVHKCIIAGDFICNLDVNNVFSKLFNDFICLHNLARYDVALGCSVTYTFHNETRGCYSTIDYMLSSDVNSSTDFNVIDSGANLSDHLILKLLCTYNLECVIADNVNNDMCPIVTHLRWDHANLSEYYSQTGICLQCILADIVSFEVNNFLCINKTYNDVINVLCSCANNFIPARKQSFYKFLWSQELDILKENCINSDKLWKAAGKPRAGDMFKNEIMTAISIKKNKRRSMRRIV